MGKGYVALTTSGSSPYLLEIFLGLSIVRFTLTPRKDSEGATCLIAGNGNHGVNATPHE